MEPRRASRSRRPALFARLLRDIGDRIPRHASVKISRRLIAQANAARDAQRYLIAASLFEEALRFSPRNHRIQVQCGHMFKEAGDFASAERHYLAARAIDGEDAEMALQLGHFYKAAGRLEEAAAAYRRALSLQPGWSELVEELARLGAAGIASDEDPRSEDGDLVRELLPSGIEVPDATLREGVRIHRLGATRLRWAGSYQRVLRGVEAIRGVCISPMPLTHMLLLVDDAIIHREPLTPTITDAQGNGKYVFNIWHDFSRYAPGRRQIELRFVDRLGRRRTHRAVLTVVPPQTPEAGADSDAYIPSAALDGDPIEAAIAALPSTVRSARRFPLPRPPRTILVQRADQLGDLACSVPAIRRLRGLFPDARLVGLVTAANADLARSLGLLDAVVVAEFPEDAGERRRTMTRDAQDRLHEALRAFDFDVAVDLGEGSGSRPLLLLSGARFLYGFKDRESPWLSAGFELNGHDPVNGLETIGHSRKLVALVESLATILGAVAEPAPRDAPGWPLLAGFGIREGERYVVLHTGARLAFSRWPHFEALATRLLAQTDCTVVLLADGLDTPRPAPTDRLKVIDGLLDFAAFDALLANAALFVGNDSGPKHLASLRGTPVVSLHMARLNWNEWGQEYSGAIVSRRVPCAGCAIHYHPDECGKDFACIRDIAVEEVLAVALRYLEARSNDDGRDAIPMQSRPPKSAA